MFLGKIKVWISIFLVLILIKSVPPIYGLIMNNIKTNKEPKTIKILSENDNLVYRFNNELNKRKLNYTNNDNSDFILTTSGTYENIENYTKIEKALYSPFVLFVPSTFNINKSELISETKDNKYITNLKVILNGIEQNKTWEDIGINSTNLGKNIILYIPDKTSSFYKNTIDLIILTLNDFKEPNEEELEILYNRTLNILSKCETFYNLKQQYIKKEHIVVLAPEMLIMDDKESFNHGNKIIYLNKTINMEYDFYINNNDEQNSSYINNVFKFSKGFINNTGLRNIYMTYNPSKTYKKFNYFSDIYISNENYLKNIDYNAIDISQHNKEFFTDLKTNDFNQKINESGAYLELK